jgi:hypothetical protein
LDAVQYGDMKAIIASLASGDRFKSSSWVVSLAVHVGLLLLLSGIVLVSTYVLQPTMEAVVSEIPVQEIPGIPDDFNLDAGGGGNSSSEAEAASSDTSTLEADAAMLDSIDLLTVQSPSTSLAIPSGTSIMAGTGAPVLGAGRGGGSGGGSGGGHGQGRGKGLFKGSIGGMQVEATVLGVVLDHSPSMRGYLPTLCRHVGISFPDAYVVSGGDAGFLQTYRKDAPPALFKDAVQRLKRVRPGEVDQKSLDTAMANSEALKLSVGDAAILLLEKYPDIDAVYIFSDLMEMDRGGDVATARQAHFEQLVRGRGAKVFAHVVRETDREPSTLFGNRSKGARYQALFNLTQAVQGGFLVGPIVSSDPGSKK